MLGLNRLKLWHEPNDNQLFLDDTPRGVEEEQYLFSNPVQDPRDLNEVILQERMQDMSQRLVYADRAFLVTMIWVVFLVLLTFLQMLFSIGGYGLSDAQFVTVVTTTTASVFGFWLLVGRYLHPNSGRATKPADRNKSDEGH